MCQVKEKFDIAAEKYKQFRMNRIEIKFQRFGPREIKIDNEWWRLSFHDNFTDRLIFFGDREDGTLPSVRTRMWVPTDGLFFSGTDDDRSGDPETMNWEAHLENTRSGNKDVPYIYTEWKADTLCGGLARRYGGCTPNYPKNRVDRVLKIASNEHLKEWYFEQIVKKHWYADLTHVFDTLDTAVLALRPTQGQDSFCVATGENSADDYVINQIQNLEKCSDVKDADKSDCHPEPFSTEDETQKESECSAKKCCWQKADADATPSCYHPPSRPEFTPKCCSATSTTFPGLCVDKRVDKLKVVVCSKPNAYPQSCPS